MDQVFKRIIDNNFSDLKGSTVSASIVVPQSVINEVIKAALRGNRNIDSVQISMQAQNRVSVDVKTTLLPWPLNLRLKLDNAVDLASYSSPKLRAWLENNLLLGSLGSLFNAFPEGVKLYGNQVVIDLGVFLRTPEQKRYLDLVKSIGIQTALGQVILDVDMKVE
jgi:hypothetical protein